MDKLHEAGLLLLVFGNFTDIAKSVIALILYYCWKVASGLQAPSLYALC